MPWQEVSIMAQRREFVGFAQQAGANKRQLCRHYGISSATAYKWLARFARDGDRGLVDRSTRPLASPGRTSAQVNQVILQARDANPAWGPRKLKHWLEAQGETGLPAFSTIAAILKRNGRIDPMEAEKHRASIRFEQENPNDLWQMDFKGDFPLQQGRCYPLTILDDHSRFALCLAACRDQTRQTVQDRLSGAFETYGMPERMLMDNGAPWGYDSQHPYTGLTVWLLRLGIRISHGRPYHPQTQGKEERFHRTLGVELLHGSSFTDLLHCQDRFNAWRQKYNFERPHQALDFATPASRYRHSQRNFPDQLPEIAYGADDLVRKVSDDGRITFRGRSIRVGKGLRGQPVALRPTADDGQWDVVFVFQTIKQIDLRTKD